MDANDERYQEEQEDRLDRAGMAVELAVLAVICKRLAKVDESTTYAVARAWQAQDMSTIAGLLKAGSAMLRARSDSAMNDVASSSDKWAEEFYAAAGVRQRKVLDDPFLSETLGMGRRAADTAVDRLCRTSVIGLVAPDGSVKRMDEAYRDAIDAAILSIRTNNYESVITDVVRRLSKGGLRVMYESGATRELYAAVTENVMDGFRGTMQKVRNQQAVQFKADGVEVSAHGLCAEDHLPYQGRQFSNAEFAEIQKKLKRPIAQGMNCRHTVTGVILGVSTKAYRPEELEAMRKASRRKTGFKTADGHELTAYEFSQWQRREETQIRKDKAQARLFEKAGLDKEAKRYEESARLRLERYRKASRAARVETREERTRVYEWKL